jgi:hypothetical protein
VIAVGLARLGRVFRCGLATSTMGPLGGRGRANGALATNRRTSVSSPAHFDPIETSGEIGLGFGIGRRHRFHGRAEGAVDRRVTARVAAKRRLRRRPIDIGGRVKTIYLDEDRPGLLGAAPARHAKTPSTKQRRT